MESHERFDWNTEQGNAIEAATEHAKRLGLASLPDLWDQSAPVREAAISLLERTFTEPLHSRPLVVGIIAEQKLASWLLLEPSDLIFDGAEVIEIRSAKSASGATPSDSANTDIELWHIIQRQPLLLRSLNGAIVGFKNGQPGTKCVVLHEGDDGWT